MRAPEYAWVKEFPGAVTVCDPDGIILEMNDKSAMTFEKDGGVALIGKNVFDCHPEPARTELKRLLESRQPNIYTIEKNGDGEYAGFIELSLEVPFDMPHFVRG